MFKGKRSLRIERFQVKLPSEKRSLTRWGGIQGMGIVWRRRGNETREGRDPRVMPNEDLELEQMV